ncbi:MAG: secretin N-terminal domain-containing protein [Candidatus Deferrimicrobiaceae bacterium]
MNSQYVVRYGIFRTMGVVACAGLFLSAWGCARPQMVRKDPPPAVTVARGPVPAPKEDVRENRQRAVSPLPEAPVRAWEGVKQSPGEFRKPAPRYTMVLAGAEAREVFLSLAKENDFNLVLSPEVSGTITMDVKGASAPEIMTEVCDLLGCRLEFLGKTVRVLPAIRVTRIFSLDYLLTSRTGSGSLTASTSTSGSSSTSGSVSGTSSSGGESQSLNTVSTEEKFDFWSGIVEEVQSMLSADGGKVVLNRATGTLVVTDFPGRVEQVGEYIATLESRSRIGVMIETRILEVALDDTTQYGIDWTAFPDLSSLSLSGSLSGGAAVRQTLQSGTNAFQIGVAGSKFDAFLDALSTQGQVNVLSAPKVSTLNNQRAIIRIGRQDVFFRATVTPASDTNAAFVTFSPDSITEGIIMSVTPQIGQDGRILLAIHPSITEKVGEATAPDGNTAPIVDVRETNTVVSVGDGDTVFIGGLMQERTQETIRSVPLLGDIPFVGSLFRHNDQQKKKTELVILITPRILRGEKPVEIAAEEKDKVLRSERGFHVGGRPWVYGTEGERKGLSPWE